MLENKFKMESDKMTSDGNIDYIYDLFDRIESRHWSCKNCLKIIKHDYLDDDFYCSGIVKRPSKSRPFDIIRECKVDFDSNGYVDQLDQTPDEALNKSRVLMCTVSHWLETNDKYIKFRGI